MKTLWNQLARTLALPRVANAIIRYARRTPYYHIRDSQEQLYMERYWLLRERSWCPLAIRIHRIARPDNDRHLHDHPCDYRTFILRGGYVERDIYGQQRIRLAGSTTANRKEHFHSIDNISDEDETWTLFAYWGKHQMWGFLANDRKVPWKQYLKVGKYHGR